MMKAIFVVASLLTLFQPCAQAADQKIGNWIVSTDKDPFSNKAKSIAATLATDMALVIRCFPNDGGLSVILMTGKNIKPFDPGDKPSYKYRADEGEIIDLKGEAFGQANIELPNADQVLKDAQTAKNIFIRIELASSSITTETFELRGGSKALQKIQSDCGK